MQSQNTRTELSELNDKSLESLVVQVIYLFQDVTLYIPFVELKKKKKEHLEKNLHHQNNNLSTYFKFPIKQM